LKNSPIGMCSSRAGRALANSAPLAERRDADRLHSARSLGFSQLAIAPAPSSGDGEPLNETPPGPI